jgi:hypothetical protein
MVGASFLSLSQQPPLAPLPQRVLQSNPRRALTLCTKRLLRKAFFYVRCVQ